MASVLPRMKLHATNLQHAREGVQMVRKVFGIGSGEAAHAKPLSLTTPELYALLLEQKPSSTFEPLNKHLLAKKTSGHKAPPNPPNMGHPVRSLSFLKDTILPQLAKKRELKIVPATRIPAISSANADAIRQAAESSASLKGNQKKSKKDRERERMAAERAAAKEREAQTPLQVWVWQKANHPNPPKKTKTEEERPFGVGHLQTGMNKRRTRTRLSKVRRELRLIKGITKRKAEESAEARKQAKQSLMNDSVVVNLQQVSPTL